MIQTLFVFAVYLLPLLPLERPPSFLISAQWPSFRWLRSSHSRITFGAQLLEEEHSSAMKSEIELSDVLKPKLPPTSIQNSKFSYCQTSSWGALYADIVEKELKGPPSPLTS